MGRLLQNFWRQEVSGSGRIKPATSLRRLVARRKEPSYAKIRQRRPPSVAEQDVGRFDVSMEDAPPVRIVQRTTERLEQRSDLFDAQHISRAETGFQAAM